MTHKKVLHAPSKKISKSYQTSGKAFHKSHGNRCWDPHGK